MEPFLIILRVKKDVLLKTIRQDEMILVYYCHCLLKRKTANKLAHIELHLVLLG